MTWTTARFRRIAVAALTVLVLASIATTVMAHESREVEGEFEFIVGFTTEPAYVDERNGLDLRIAYINSDENANDDEEGHGLSNPVENAEQTLQAEIQFGGESMELDLRAVWGQPGHYTADVIPTSTGAYTFQITGEIDGVQINETFQSGPDTFSEVEPRDSLEFPGGASAGDDDSNQVAAMGIAGVVAGLLGLLAGGVAYFKVSNPEGRKNPAQQRREQRQASQQKQE